MPAARDDHRVDVPQVSSGHNEVVQERHVSEQPLAFELAEMVEETELIVGEFPRTAGHGEGEPFPSRFGRHMEMGTRGRGCLCSTLAFPRPLPPHPGPLPKERGRVIGVHRPL